MPTMTTVSFPLIKLDATSTNLIVNGALDAKFTVSMYYTDLPADSRVVIAMNGDYSSVKTFIPSVKTFPSGETVTSAQLKTLFGLAKIIDGDYFEVGLDVQMQDGNWYPAFNPQGISYSSGLMNQPGASPTIIFKAPLPIDAFVGKYVVDEPAEGWTYNVAFTRASITSLKIDKYWFSWPAVFTLDFDAKTYSMPKTDFGDGYAAIESGTIDPVTGTMVGNYTIYQNGAVAETGVHTYTKK